MAVTRIIEKPGGARDIYLWDLHIVRRLPRYPGDPLREPEFGVHLDIEFTSEDAAEEFEAKIRALLPEVKR